MLNRQTHCGLHFSAAQHTSNNLWKPFGLPSTWACIMRHAVMQCTPTSGEQRYPQLNPLDLLQSMIIILCSFAR